VHETFAGAALRGRPTRRAPVKGAPAARTGRAVRFDPAEGFSKKGVKQSGWSFI